MTSSRIPIPPTQCMPQRQSCMEGASASTLARTVAPVVVNPEVDSKKASVKVGNCGESQKGRAPKMKAPIHTDAARTKPSRGESSPRAGPAVNSTTAPAPAVTRKE